ncbi:EF-hand domain-containing protein [Frigoriglobus tundricola]|uniref:EF-hand domain-containing protein n=1 Tax=Frigoriglobus tundricola TaxID=2774151 RepID=A0A6M5YPA0_9BACT|nr:EF-hand domain-containing protein [Frigoriglobus tundricola]QJW95798.1 hypothetical protein FTUN_3352 [Frigoriglobus tundricola]
MWKKWLAFSGMLALIILLDPTHTPAQPEGGGKGKGGRGGFGGFGGPPPDGNTNGQGGGPGGGWPGGGMGGPGGPGGGMGGPGGPGGGGMGRGGFRMDPEVGWMMLQRWTNSTGNTVDLSQIPPETRTMINGFAQRFGTNPLPESGTMSKEQYLEFTAQNEALRAANGGGRGGMGGPNGGGGPGQGGWGPGGWDPNQGGPGQRPFEKKQTEEERPVAMRYGKLPKDLPPWFDEYDTDKDGQISLYEYRKSGKDSKEALTREFLKMDMNSDGLLTADELLRFTRQNAIKEKVDAYDESGGTERPSSWGLGAPVEDKGDNNKGGNNRGRGGPGGGGMGGPGGSMGGPGGGMGGPGGGMGRPGGGMGGPGGGWPGGGMGGPGGGMDWPGGGGGPGGRGGDNTKGPDPKGGDNGGRGGNRGKKGPG